MRSCHVSIVIYLTIIQICLKSVLAGLNGTDRRWICDKDLHKTMDDFDMHFNDIRITQHSNNTDQIVSGTFKSKKYPFLSKCLAFYTVVFPDFYDDGGCNAENNEYSTYLKNFTKYEVFDITKDVISHLKKKQLWKMDSVWIAFNCNDLNLTEHGADVRKLFKRQLIPNNSSRNGSHYVYSKKTKFLFKFLMFGIFAGIGFFILSVLYFNTIIKEPAPVKVLPKQLPDERGAGKINEKLHNSVNLPDDPLMSIDKGGDKDDLDAMLIQDMISGKRYNTKSKFKQNSLILDMSKNSRIV